MSEGLKKDGVIRHIGLSTHNPAVAKMAALSGEIEDDSVQHQSCF